MEDATKVLIVANVRFETCDTGYELPLAKSVGIVDMCGILEREVASSNDFQYMIMNGMPG